MHGLMVIKGFMTIAIVGWYSAGVWRVMNAYFDNAFKDHLTEKMKDPALLRRTVPEAVGLPPLKSPDPSEKAPDLPPLNSFKPPPDERRFFREKPMMHYDEDEFEEVCPLERAPSKGQDSASADKCGGSP